MDVSIEYSKRERNCSPIDMYDTVQYGFGWVLNSGGGDTGVALTSFFVTRTEEKKSMIVRIIVGSSLQCITVLL